MLLALRSRYAPSDATQIRELKLKYEKVKTSTSNRKPEDNWLQNWEVVYTEYLDYLISEMDQSGTLSGLWTEYNPNLQTSG
jgi:hypothetical protein